MRSFKKGHSDALTCDLLGARVTFNGVCGCCKSLGVLGAATGGSVGVSTGATVPTFDTSTDIALRLAPCGHSPSVNETEPPRTHFVTLRLPAKLADGKPVGGDGAVRDVGDGLLGVESRLG